MTVGVELPYSVMASGAAVRAGSPGMMGPVMPTSEAAALRAAGKAGLLEIVSVRGG
jgi:hypothetical protein